MLISTRYGTGNALVYWPAERPKRRQYQEAAGRNDINIFYLDRFLFFLPLWLRLSVVSLFSLTSEGTMNTTLVNSIFRL